METKTLKIPKDYPVKPLKANQTAKVKATCGTCGLSWDDGVSTSMTPTPSARCPFEAFHHYKDTATHTPKVLETFLDGLDASVDGRGWGMEHENARKFLATAVNSHDELIDALCKLRHELKYYKTKSMTKLWDIADKAIAKAEGK